MGGEGSIWHRRMLLSPLPPTPFDDPVLYQLVPLLFKKTQSGGKNPKLMSWLAPEDLSDLDSEPRLYQVSNGWGSVRRQGSDPIR